MIIFKLSHTLFDVLRRTLEIIIEHLHSSSPYLLYPKLTFVHLAHGCARKSMTLCSILKINSNRIIVLLHLNMENSTRNRIKTVTLNLEILEKKVVS